jgi:hypothetical protein
MTPILGSATFILSLGTLVLYSCGQRGAKMKGNKNPYTMLTLGLLLLKVIMSIHLFISYFRIEENSLICQLEGLIVIFVIFTTAGYYFSLAHLVLKASVVFNPGTMKSKNYHIYSIVFGMSASVLALILNDIGITSFDSCGTARGSLHELAYGIMIFIIWPYIVLSAIILGMKWKKERLVESQKNLFLIHILGVITFTVSWMPFILVHFLSFAVPSTSGFTSNTPAISFRYLALALFCLSGGIFSLFRLFFCYSLRSIIKNMKYRRFKCDSRFDYFLNEGNGSDDEKRMSSYTTSLENRDLKSTLASKKLLAAAKAPEMDGLGNAFINLTNRETFNNLIGTYSAITLILKNIYEKYYTDNYFAEMVDNLSSQTYSYPACAMDKVRQYFKLSELPDNIKDDFCSFMETNSPLTDIDCEVTEYASALFQNIRTLNSLSSESLYNSLNPKANKKILLKSFEKTSAKGGKPLIKTHDKRFLIKEVSEEERDFFLSLVKNYHAHLLANPRSLLAKIYGIFSIKVNNKNKVYHILMENLDPLDDEFILFKYDMKFSTVNRKEINSNSTIRAIKNTFMKQLPWAKELFDTPEEIFDDSKSKNRSSGGYHTALRKNPLNKIEERSLEGSDDDDHNGETFDETKDYKKNIKDDPYFHQDNDDDVLEDDEDKETIMKNQTIKPNSQSDEDEKYITRVSGNSKESKLKRGFNKLLSKNTYFRGSNHSSSNFDDENEFVDQATLKKLGLLKDEDFLRIHKALFVDMDCKMEVEMLNSSLGKDVKFLTDLNIMDYSLFVVILQAPNDDPCMRDSNTEHQDSDSEDVDPESHSSSFTEKQANLTKAIASLVAGNKYVLYSRKRNFIYLVGLIDYLQKYIRKKKLERLGKQLVAFNNLSEGDTDFSCQPPEQYAQRFMEKVTQVFIVPDSAESNSDEVENQNIGYCRKRF